MRDVIGYEEKKPATMAAIRWGYPRFVHHAYVEQVAEHAARQQGIVNQPVYALVSLQAAHEFVQYVQSPHCAVRPANGFVLVAVANDVAVIRRARAFTQHTGLAISSRQAEDYLVGAGLLSQPFAEPSIGADDAESLIKATLSAYVASDVIELCNSGMNAFYASFKAARAIQQKQGRTVYVQLGWLYMDTQKVLEQFLAEDETVITVLDVFDKAKIEAIFKQYAGQIAAVVTELPTNPLLQTLDVEWLSELCLQAGAIRIFDPTMSSVFNVNVLPYTDVLVTSLTKYAASGGDVMVGAYALNPNAAFYSQLKTSVRQESQPPYVRDLNRLAWHMQSVSQLVAAINVNTVKLVDYLERHTAVRRVHWALSDASAANYTKIALGACRPGGMVTIELKGDLSAFYDVSTVVKGPSFGTHFTMMCPFMYLAHYDWVSRSGGRDALRKSGLDPELVRISVGTEPMEAIIAALRFY